MTARPVSYVTPLGTDQFGLVDEGGYFCVTNNQSGLAMTSANTAFTATTPFIVAFNKAAAGGPHAYLDFLTLIATAAGSSGTNVQFAAVVDQGNRFSTGGTEITANIVNPYFDQSGASNLRVWAGTVTATAASSTARTVVGNRFLVGAIPAVGDTYVVKFGGNESNNQIAKQTITFTEQNVPKIVVGPQESVCLYLWEPSMSTASSFIPEMGWVER